MTERGCLMAAKNKIELKVSLFVGITALIGVVAFKLLFLIGSNMGPPNNRKEALRYLSARPSEFDERSVTRLVNLADLTDAEVMRFLSAESDAVWYFIGENMSVSDAAIIEGYDKMSMENKARFRDNWKYWGWTGNRRILARHVFAEPSSRNPLAEIPTEGADR